MAWKGRYVKCPLCGWLALEEKWRNRKKRTTPRDHELIITKEQRASRGTHGKDGGFFKVDGESTPIGEVLSESDLRRLDLIRRKILEVL